MADDKVVGLDTVYSWERSEGETFGVSVDVGYLVVLL